MPPAPIGSSPQPAFDGALLEASSERVVFVRAAHFPLSLRLAVAALGIGLAPIAASLMTATSAIAHFAVAGFVPALFSAWGWSLIPYVALAWSRLPPLCGRLVVERTAGDAYRRNPRWQATVRGRPFGPEGRRGLFQMRLYDELVVAGETPLHEQTTEAFGTLPKLARRIIVANVLVVGDQATIVSSSASWPWNAEKSAPQYMETAAAIEHDEDRARSSYTKESMKPLVDALLGVLDLPARAPREVPRVVWTDSISGMFPQIVGLTFFLRVLYYVVLGVNIERLGQAAQLVARFEWGFALLALEALGYVMVVQKCFLQPLNVWITRFMDDYTTTE